MTTKIWTSSTCDRCGTGTNREGSMPNTLPDRWARIEIKYNSYGPTRSPKELCQSCYFQLDDWMRHPPIKGTPDAD